MLEQQPTFRLGVFDINGTIHTNPDGISSEVSAGFKHLRSIDIPSTIITGRSIGRARDLLGSSWGNIVSEDMPISVENGARLATQEGDNIRFHRLGMEAIEATIDAVQNADEPVRYLAYTPEEPGARSVLWLPKNGTPEEYLRSNGTHTEIVRGSLGKLAARMTQDHAGMLRVGSTSAEMIELLAETNVFLNQAELNILPLGIDKASGVIDIAEHLDVPLSKVLIAGDDENDLPMFGLPVFQKIFVGGTLLSDIRLGVPTIALNSPKDLGNYLSNV